MEKLTYKSNIRELKLSVSEKWMLAFVAVALLASMIK